MHFFTKRYFSRNACKTIGLTPQKAAKTTKDRPKTGPRAPSRASFSISKIGFDFASFWGRFWCHFGSPRPPLWAPFSAPKTRMHAHTNACMHACVRVCVCASDRPRWPQEALGRPKRPPGGPQKALRSPKEALKRSPRRPRGPFWLRISCLRVTWCTGVFLTCTGC